MAMSSDFDGRRARLVDFMKMADEVVHREERTIAAATSHMAQATRSGLDVLSYLSARQHQLDAASEAMRLEQGRKA